MTNVQKAIFILAILSSSLAVAEPTALLEACNNIPNSAKRLECFEELFKSRPQAQSSSSASNLREAIIGLNGAIASQISLSQYKALRLELAKQLSIYKASTNANLHVVQLARVRHQNADFAFLVKPFPCESTTYAHFCGSFVVATA